MTGHTWDEHAYGPITGDGARKLSDSAVAPLVALARGYWTAKDKDDTKQMASRATAASGGTIALTRQLNSLIAGDEDILVMPWFSLGGVLDKGLEARSYNTQYRPSRPLQSGGKPVKYAWFKGEGTVLDLHPATPPEWVAHSGDVMVAEGLLKADSALTGYLLDGAATREELSIIPDSPEAARVRLREIMEAVPESRRMPIIGTASVTTWADQGDQWRHIRFGDRRVILAFDGDVASNRNVWRQVNKAMAFFRTRKGKPEILSMFDADVEAAKLAAGFAPEDKIGVDDYLSKIGTWADVKRLITGKLPAEPAGSEKPAVPGDWRVHPDNDGIVQEYMQERGPSGELGPAHWVTRTHIGGRVIATQAVRRPTDQELRTGQVDAKAEMLLEDAGCELEIALLDPDGDIDATPVPFKVTGPVTMLSLHPREWVKHARQLPNEVLNHPDWPPRKGEDWLSAIKGNRREETETRIVWNTMGWVPVPESEPAFIIGDQVLGRTPRDEAVTGIGVTDHELSGASSFGVIDTYRDMDEDAWKAQVRDDIRAVVGAFIDQGFWHARSTAVTVLAAMLRPTIPVRPRVTVYFTGPKGAGKSYTASFVMAGWQHTPGTWTVQNLPADAGDTAAAIEHAVSRASIMVVDDLAPQTDRRKAEEQETTLGRIIRSVHNNSGRRRMDGRTMSQREVANPIAMLVITAENPPQVPSIQDRIISIEVPRGAFDDSDGRAAERHLDRVVRGGAPARLTAAMARLWQQADAGLGRTWADRYETAERMLDDEEATAIAVLGQEYDIAPGEAARRAKQVANLGVSFQALYALAVWAGIDEDDPILANLGGGDGYMKDLYEMAARHIKRARSTTPGRALLGALARLLGSGRAHLRNPTTAGAPPVTARAGDTGGVDTAALNEALGWEFDAGQGTWKPRGQMIGYFGVNPSDEQVAHFDKVNAFREAQRLYPQLVPHGMMADASWESVWQEGLTATAPRMDSVSSRLRLSQDADSRAARVRGVPVLLEALLQTQED